MAQFTEERFEQALRDILTAFSDGFQFADLGTLADRGVVFAQAFDLTGAEKKALVLRLSKRVLEATDFPYLPDKFVLPIVGDVGADALILRFLPGLIDTIVTAYKSKFEEASATVGPRSTE